MHIYITKYDLLVSVMLLVREFSGIIILVFNNQGTLFPEEDDFFCSQLPLVVCNSLCSV